MIHQNWNVRSQIIRETQDTEIRIYCYVNKARVLFFVYKYMQCKHRNYNFRVNKINWFKVFIDDILLPEVQIAYFLTIVGKSQYYQ